MSVTKHDTLDLVLDSITSQGDGWLSGRIYVPAINADSDLEIETTDGELDENHRLCIVDCLQLPSETKDAVGRAMLAMHLYFADECGDLDVSLSTVGEIWEHTHPWYVIIQHEGSDQHRFLRFHFKADWETYHGVEVIIRNGRDVVFVGNCGETGAASDIEAGREEGNFVGRPLLGE